jgi:two-component system, NarL family, nitrate/nitrite sensor histidine kinase NarX
MSSSANYPVRLGRRLTVALAFIVLIMLCAGAFSIHLGKQINRINKAIDQQHAHALAAGVIHARLHHLVSEILYIQATGGLEQAPRVRDLRQDLAQAIRAFVDFHRTEKQSSDEALEEPILVNLARLEADLGALSERSAMVFGEGKLLNQADVKQLSDLMIRVMRNGEELSRFHRDLVTRLSAESQRLDTLGVRIYLAFSVIAGLLVGLAGLVLQRRIATPLARLSRAALEIADGRLGDRVPITTHDDIGQLSHSFNAMADQLQARERELKVAEERLRTKLREMEVLNQIGMQLMDRGGLSGQDAILGVIAERARELLGVDASAICLAMMEPESVLVHSISGPDEAFSAKAGAVRRSAACDGGVPHTIADCPVFRPEFAGSHFTLPLQRGGETRGLLCVATREQRTLAAEQIELLTAFSAQAAITIEQFRLDAEIQKLATFEERGRIAREIHDGLAQTVSLLHLRIRQAQAKASRERFSPLDNDLEEMAIISGGAYEEVRNSISGLRIQRTPDQGLAAALGRLLHDFSAQTRLPVELKADGAETVQLSPETELEMVRIVREALHNVRKHAQVDRATVHVEHRDAAIRVRVEDHGRGFDPATIAANGRHFGLRSMEERVERCGGTLEIVSAPGCGTRVTMVLPLEDRA